MRTMPLSSSPTAASRKSSYAELRSEKTERAIAGLGTLGMRTIKRVHNDDHDKENRNDDGGNN